MTISNTEEPEKPPHSDCMVTTSIADTIEAGKGNLDWNGFWEFPCAECTAFWRDYWEQRRPKEK